MARHFYRNKEAAFIGMTTYYGFILKMALTFFHKDIKSLLFIKSDRSTKLHKTLISVLCKLESKFLFFAIGNENIFNGKNLKNHFLLLIFFTLSPFSFVRLLLGVQTKELFLDVKSLESYWVMFKWGWVILFLLQLLNSGGLGGRHKSILFYSEHLSSFLIILLLDLLLDLWAYFMICVFGLLDYLNGSDWSAFDVLNFFDATLINYSLQYKIALWLSFEIYFLSCSN